MPDRVLTAFALAVLAFAAAQAVAQPGDTTRDHGGDDQPHHFTLSGHPIDAGFVLIDGGYLPRPYRVSVVDDLVCINGVAVPELDLTKRWGRWTRWTDTDPLDPGRAAIRVATFVESRIERGGMLIAQSPDGLLLLHEHDAAVAIAALHAEQTPEATAQLLQAMSRRPVAWETWQALIEAHRPNAVFLAEAQAILDAVQARRDAAHRQPSALATLVTRSIPWTGTLIMIAAVGVLIRAGFEAARQSDDGGWRHVDQTGRRGRVVGQLLVMLIALNVADLLFTTVGHHTGLIVELNPIGQSLLHNPMLLAAFKVTFAGAGIAVLFCLRRLRFAERAAWWLCATYTALMLHWVTTATGNVG